MINVNTGFATGSKDAIDARIVLTKEQMLNINENTQPDVYIATCLDDGCLYIYNKDNVANAETGKFSIVKTEGGALVFTKAEWEALDPKPADGTQVIISDDTINEDTLPFKFGIDENGNYGYYKVGADTVTPFKSDDGATILRGTMVGSSNNTFTTEKACEEITITFGFSKTKFAIKVNGEDKTSLLNNYGSIDTDHGMSSATISGDFPIGTEISIQNKAESTAGYVICY